ncbi:MAG: HAD-IA family hydrolase [Asticcacaulis sp.]
MFDVDGTLIDSRSSIHRAAVEAADAIGVSRPSYDQVRAIVGLSLFEALAKMRPDLDEPAIHAYTDAYKAAFVRFHADPDFFDALYPGAADLLLQLKSEGWIIGMATGQSRRGVERNMDVHGWRDLFDVTFCADDGPSKPHPHMLNCNIAAAGVRPHQAVMIGDTAHDMHMAVQADVHAIGVSWGFHTVEELRHAGAHLIVDDFAALSQHLMAFEPLELT